jgi:hypothetical protein
MATRAGCDNALAILAIVLSFIENAADFVAPTPVYYIAILRLIFSPAKYFIVCTRTLIE